jgi:hypothetical protein
MEEENVIEAYDFECVLHDTNSHQLLSVISAIHHQRVCQAFDDGALGFSEAFDGIATGGVGDVDRSADLDVVTTRKQGVSKFLDLSMGSSSLRHRLVGSQIPKHTSKKYP